MINFCVREALNFFSDPTQQFGLTTTVPAVNDPTQQFGLATTVSGVCEALTFFPDPMQQFGFGTVMAGERVPSRAHPEPQRAVRRRAEWRAHRRLRRPLAHGR